jgi:hypothetical protein
MYSFIVTMVRMSFVGKWSRCQRGRIRGRPREHLREEATVSVDGKTSRGIKEDSVGGGAR